MNAFSNPNPQHVSTFVIHPNLTDATYREYARLHFHPMPDAEMYEFEEDLDKVKYVKRLLGRYVTKGSLQERLCLNHIIGLVNVFGVEATNRMLFLRCDPSLWAALKSLLVYLDYHIPVVSGVDGRDIVLEEIPGDRALAEALSQL